MTGITKDEMKELFTQFFGAGGGAVDGSKNFDELKKKVVETTDALKKQVPIHKQMEGFLKGQKQQYVDVEKQLEDLDKAIEEATKGMNKHTKQLEQEELIEQRSQIASAAAAKNAKIAVSNFAVSVGNIAESLIKGAFQYAKDLQSGATGVEAGTSAAIKAARVAGDTVSSIGQVAAGVGQFASLMPGWGGVIGKGITLVGTVMEVFGKKAADVSEAGLKFLGDELQKTVKGFRSINESGALFGGGMTEMRKVAASAGLDIAQLATVVRDSRTSLQMLGLGFAEGTKRIAGVSKELRSSELGTQLRKLGYSTEEQASLAADLMANQRAAGNTRIQSDKAIAEQTAAYGKDLKVLADITGQDAKKAAEKARITSMQADIMAKLGPKEAERFQAQLRGMPEALQKGFIQYVSSGGKAVTDTATNILMAQQPEVAKTFQQGLENIRDTSKTASDVQQEALEQRARLGEAERQRARSGDAVINMANTLGTGVSSAVSATSELTNSLLLQTQSTEEATKKSKENADLAEKNAAPLDVAVAKIEEDAQKLRSAMGEELTPAVTTFAKGLASATQTVAEAMEKAGLKQMTTGEKIGSAAGGVVGGAAGAWGGSMAGAATGAAIGSIIPGLGTAIGGLIGGLVGMAGGGYAGSEMGSAGGKWLGAKFGDGGIVDRPTKALIGESGLKEAVIPLPNGKSIPLDLDVGKLTSSLADVTVKAMKLSPLGLAAGALSGMTGAQAGGDDTAGLAKDQVNLLTEIKDILSNSKDLQQQYVYNTYN